MGTRTIRNYLFILFALNILVAFVTVFLSYDLLNNKLVEVGRLNAELVSLRDINTKTSIVDKIVKDTKDERSRLDLYFITKGTMSNFIGELESLALREGVVFRLNGLSVAKEKTGSRASYLRFDLRVEGSFANVYHFLRVLESMPYKLRFNSVRITKETSFWSGEMSIDLISYIDK